MSATLMMSSCLANAHGKESENEDMIAHYQTAFGKRNEALGTWATSNLVTRNGGKLSDDWVLSAFLRSSRDERVQLKPFLPSLCLSSVIPCFSESLSQVRHSYIPMMHCPGRWVSLVNPQFCGSSWI